MKIEFPDIEGFHPISIPFTEGNANLISANIFALGSGPIILVDAGPKFPGALDFLEEKLNLAGFGFSDIEKIILTHGHVDHIGLVKGIRDAAGRPISCFLHPNDRLHVLPESFENNFWDQEKEDFLIKAGAPPAEIKKLSKHFAFFRNLADPIEDYSFLEDGSCFTGEDYNLEVIHTPGHSPGSCCFYERKRKILFTGDAVIGHITPNPFVELNADLLNITGYQSLKAYMASLERLMGLRPDYVFPGHGKPVEDLQRLISSYLEHHRDRMLLIRDVLHKKPGPLYALLGDVFPAMSGYDLFMAVSDLYAHMEILISEGRACLTDSGPPEQYHAV